MPVELDRGIRLVLNINTSITRHRGMLIHTLHIITTGTVILLDIMDIMYHITLRLLVLLIRQEYIVDTRRE